MPDAVAPDVYSASDIAAASGTTDDRVEGLIARGEIRSLASFPHFVPHDEAVRAVRALRSGSTVGVPDALGLGRELFTERASKGRSNAMPFVVSTSLHAIVAATILFIASLGYASADEPTIPLEKPEPLRMVFLAIPGPGGGGGGGGFKMKAPPPTAQRKGPAKISSPLPARQLPPPIRPVPKPPEPPPPPLVAKQLPPVMAPIVTRPAETKDVEGVMAKAPEAPPSQGPGSGGSVGSGKGTGIGQGEGP